MDNKRNGSGPPPPPQRSGRYEWNEPLPQTPAPFQFTDDDDELPLPGGRSHSSDMLDDDELLGDDDDDDDGGFVDSALVRDVRPAHSAPPPLPSPMPARAGSGAFLDDGEIALPPGLSQVVRTQNGRFPVREIEVAEDLDDDDDDADDAFVRPRGPATDDDLLSADDFGAELPPDSDAPEADLAPPPRSVPSLAARPWSPGPVSDDDELPPPPRSRPAPPPAPPPAPAPPPTLRRARDEDDFGDLNEPSRAVPAAAARAPAPAPRPAPPPRRARDEDDFGDLNEPSRALHAAVDLSGLAPAPAPSDSIDDAPLPPPPPADLDDDEPLPPLIAGASSGQSGVSFNRGELALDEPAPPPPVAEPVRAFTAPAPKDSPSRPPSAPSPSFDDSGDELPLAPAAGLAPAPSEPLGEPFPLDLWSDPEELIGRDLGRYRLVKPLSRGLTTRVYAAIDEQSGRHVAIRILGPTHSPAERRARQFLYEAQQLARLHHESIVEVVDTGSTSDYLSYYVMERLEGESLAAALRMDGPLPWQQVAILTTQICEALIVAADKNIHAGDLNLGAVVRLRDDGDDGRRRQPIKLLGVGVSPVASVYRSPDGNLVESKGTPPGTAEYMAPEIASGGFPDAASAVYAIGVMMYELLTGRPPFRGDSFLAVLKKHMYDEPQPPTLVVPEQEIAEPFEQVILRALAKDPSRRFPTIRALHESVLAARAREGELRRATAILSLDPASWDEDSARKDEPSRPLPQSRSEPQPLRSFTADLRKNDPALAEAVLGASPAAAKSAPVAAPRPSSVPTPRTTPVSEPRAIPIPPVLAAPPPPAPPAPVTASSPTIAKPEPSMVLSQLAPPIRAPEPILPPQPVTSSQMPLIVVSPPPPVASGNLVRNVSIAVVVGSALIFFALWMSRGPAPQPARKGDAVAESSKRAAKDREPSKPRRTRESRREPEPAPQPIVVSAPPVPEARPEPPQPVALPTPEPPQPALPTPEPAVARPEPTPQPEPVAQPKPEPEPAPQPEPEPKPEPVAAVVPQPEPRPEPTEPAKPKPRPKAVDSDLPARIEPIRLKSRYAAMEPRIAARCAALSGLGAAARIDVTVKIVVDTQGVVKATTQKNWAGTPLGRCVEDFVESIRFNESQQGGSRTHTFSF